MAEQRPTLNEIGKVLERGREAAVDYYALTGKPLGITGEVGEYEAARLLDLTLAGARAPGYDAMDSAGKTYQIKTRAMAAGPRPKSQRMGSIKLDHDWDFVLLVLLDSAFRPLEIWQADRPAVTEAIQAPGSKARNERGALAVSKFKSIGRLRWRQSDL